MVNKIDGDLDITGKLFAATYQNLQRTDLRQDLIYFPIPLDNFRVHDAYNSWLPSSASADDLGLVDGTFGTNVPSIQTGDVKGLGTTTMYARQLVPMPAEYQDGQGCRLRLLAGMKTTVADTSAKIDAEAYLSDGETAVDGGGDLVTTAEQSINFTTAAYYDFTLTPSSLTELDLLDVRIKIEIVDGSTPTAVIGILTAAFLGATVKG